MKAACDTFEITVTGKGTHAAMPHLGADPIPAACEMVMALQTIVSRAANPVDSAMLTVTQLRAGETTNVIPDMAVLGGTTRSFLEATRDMIEARMRLIADHIAAAHGVAAKVRYERRYPSLVNHRKEAETAAAAAAAVVGADNVDADAPPNMGAEDFAYMLERVPGCYVLIGAGESSPPLHASTFDFNDEILVIGASYWARLVETVLGVPAGAD
jgi:hippurate hydrolase